MWLCQDQALQIMQICTDVSLGRFLTFDLDLETLFHEKLNASLGPVHSKL